MGLTFPDVVREKALVAGASDWLREVPRTLAALEREWAIEIGSVYDGGTEALVVDATTSRGEPAVLKLCVPREIDAARREIVALAAADGRGAVRLLRHDVARGALLLERLGPSMNDLGVPIAERHATLTVLAQAFWHRRPELDLPSGRDQAIWLEDHVLRSFDDLDGACSE